MSSGIVQVEFTAGSTSWKTISCLPVC